MRGHVPTPDGLADKMVEKLFRDNPPEDGERILYPGCGRGPFISAVHRYCDSNNLPVPEGVAVEIDPELYEDARKRHEDKEVEFLERDFLTDSDGLDEFEYVLGNPPYIPIEGLEEDEKGRYRRGFETAEGRFDLYVLFFEQALDLLSSGGRLCFVTPEKFEYTETTAALRRVLASFGVEEIHHVDEDSFEGLVTYPTVTVIDTGGCDETRVVGRDGEVRDVDLPNDGNSWAATVRGGEPDIETGVTLGDVCRRISCGVATGADKVFVMDREEAPPQLDDWTYPTTSGKQLRINDGPESGQVFVCPYDSDGRLPSRDELGDFGEWASLYRERLEDRSCYEKGKQVWYGWHENPPMDDILQRKLLCKDVTEEPHFWRDDSGEVVPRHSVYYLIPEEGVDIEELQDYLNSGDVQAWLEANCQRAANGFLRLQSTVMKQLPVPEHFGDHRQSTLTAETG
jgi:hypothetical protein